MAALTVKLILASSSPRRRELMGMTGLPFAVRVGETDENIGEPDPEKRVRLLALRKAEAAWRGDPEEAILGADTLVYLKGRLLGKPSCREEARAMLRALSGAEHTVYTGLCLRTEAGAKTMSCATRVWFRTLSEEEIEEYLDTGEPMDKAGAYGIQGRGALLVQRIDGDFYNVVGLPLSALTELLQREGLWKRASGERD